ncbi:MAG: hypothetical protein PHS44_00655 [Candidatus Dojkabacteria bacterium]|nr:hypothetical protein [Candidatus Dojkabacteria bacterium]
MIDLDTVWSAVGAPAARRLEDYEKALSRMQPENLSPYERALTYCLASLEPGVDTLAPNMLSPIPSADLLSQRTVESAIRVLQNRELYSIASNLILKLVARPDQLPKDSAHYRAVASTAKMVEIEKNLPILKLVHTDDSGSITEAILKSYPTIGQFLSAVERVRHQIPRGNQRRISTIAENLYGANQAETWKTMEQLRITAERL